MFVYKIKAARKSGTVNEYVRVIQHSSVSIFAQHLNTQSQDVKYESGTTHGE